MIKIQLITIIIPNYNRAAYLKEALHSLLQQTYENWEALVVDDGSTDASDKVAEDFKDPRIQFIERARLPKGAPACRNIGIERALGEFIIFLDSDDVLAVHCLEQRSKYMQTHKDLDFAVFPMLFFNKTPNDSKLLWNKKNRTLELERFINLDTVWQTTGPIWKKKALQKIGGFDEGLHCWQDVQIHAKALMQQLKYKMANNVLPDAYYRKESKDSISQSGTSSLPKMESKKRVYFYIKKNSIIDPHNMGLHILFSALKSNKHSFANTFLKESKITLSVKESKVILLHKVAYQICRGRIKILTKLAARKRTQIMILSQIGTHRYES